jgi:hypothetical protein
MRCIPRPFQPACGRPPVSGPRPAASVSAASVSAASASNRWVWAARVATALALLACGAEEPSRVSLPVRADARDIEVIETDRGYTIELSEARLAVADLQFAIAGEEHAASPWRTFHDWLVPVAHAHPGHSSGGDVTGELLGEFVIRWLPRAEAPLGLATLLEGDYQSANFAFVRAAAEEGLPADDALLGHTAVLRGTATRGADRLSFVAVLDAPDTEELVGVPFQADIRAGVPTVIGFELLPRDPFEGDTLFDGIDFVQLARDASGVVNIMPGASDAEVAVAYERLLTTFQTPDHFRMQGVPAE